MQTSRLNQILNLANETETRKARFKKRSLHKVNEHFLIGPDAVSVNTAGLKLILAA